MSEGLEFPSGGDFFGSDLKSFVASESRATEAAAHQQMMDQFSPQVFKDTFKEQIAHSLQVPQEYAESERGDQKLEEISDYLFHDRKIEQLQDISKELVKVLSSLSLKEHHHSPQDMVEGIWELIQHVKQRRNMESEIGKRDKIWPKTPQSV